MSFDEVQFPTNISYGSAGGPGFSTHIIQTDSGQEHRIARWSTPRRRYNVAYGIKSHDDLAELLSFYIARNGPAVGFRYKDFADFSTHPDHRSPPRDIDSFLGTGDGENQDFQLRKVYSSGGVDKTRIITKPAGSVLMRLDAVQQEDTTYTVDDTTGVVRFNSPPAEGVEVRGGCYYDVPVRFGAEVDDVLSMSIDNFGSGSSEDIPLVEIRDGQADVDTYYSGGAAEVCMDTSGILTGHRLQILQPQTSMSFTLPTPSVLDPGGPHYLILNIDDTNSGTVLDHDGTSLVTLDPGEGIYGWVSISSDGTHRWYLA